MNTRTLSMGVATTLLCLTLTACGSKVNGNTYEAGPITIAFQSGGKATFGSARIAAPCTYTESGSKVTLTCNGDTMVFTLDSDGNLNGPPDSLSAS